MLDQKSSIDLINYNNTKNMLITPQTSCRLFYIIDKHQKKRSTLNYNENYYSYVPNEKQEFTQKKKIKKERNQIFI